MVMSQKQYAAQNHNLLIANKSSEYAAKFNHFGRTVTNQNCIHNGIKSRLNSGNAHQHSVQNLSSYCHLSNSVRIKIYEV
jgi:hypothetical protein